MRVWCVSLLVFGLAATVLGHSYHLGTCPVVEPMAGFDMGRFLGIWYVIQKTSTASNCITYNFTRGEEPREFVLEQVSQHFALGLTPLRHEYHYTGHLTVPEPAVPARMTVKFPLSVAGSATYTVLSTDYETYAGIFTCQKLAFAHRQSATILSRTKTLDKAYIDKVRSRLSTFSVDPFELSIISQENCPKNPPGADPGVNINIDDQTFTAHSAAEVVRKAGEKIGDGIEYVAGGAKKIYNHYSNNNDSNTNSRREKLMTASPESDAEWLP